MRDAELISIIAHASLTLRAMPTPSILASSTATPRRPLMPSRMRALYSDGIIEDVRTQVRHWREECGKVHAHRLEMLDVLKRAIAVWDAEAFDEAAADAVLKSAIETVARLEPRT